MSTLNQVRNLSDRERARLRERLADRYAAAKPEPKSNLVAYVEADGMEEHKLRRALSDRLPDAAIPAVTVTISSVESATVATPRTDRFPPSPSETCDDPNAPFETIVAPASI